jgi:hypothetical protein
MAIFTASHLVPQVLTSTVTARFVAFGSNRSLTVAARMRFRSHDREGVVAHNGTSSYGRLGGEFGIAACPLSASTGRAVLDAMQHQLTAETPRRRLLNFNNAVHHWPASEASGLRGNAYSLCPLGTRIRSGNTSGNSTQVCSSRPSASRRLGGEPACPSWRLRK